MISEENILAARILAVDDNILNIEVLKKILSSAGFTNVTTTTDATQALKLYKELKPDLILLDINMPNLDGFGVMAQLTLESPADYMPILILSAEEESIRFKAFQCGAKDFLRKPYDRLDVVLRSRNIIEVRLLYNQIKTQNLSLEEQISLRTKEIKDTRLEVVQRLSHAAEMRDTDTGDHIQRMSRYCEVLARALGFSESQCELILTASPLHDIGKIAIPDSILLKQGKLTHEEYEIMKTHVAYGAKILARSQSPFLKIAETIAISHHEKFDGTGYPNKLKGEDIPIEGRICAIADVLDALTSKRPYKEPWSFDDAIVEINKGSGTHFDPKLIEALNASINDLKKIYAEYQ